MFEENFSKTKKSEGDRSAIIVKTKNPYSLGDTLLCGQCFRYEEIKSDDSGCEYMTVVGDEVIFVGQRKKGELIFYGITEEVFERLARPYFDIDTDYEGIKEDIQARLNSEFLALASECGSGIAILRQDPWETLCSFIISQNNNIPRIRRIIREISAAYGVNLALQKHFEKCPIGKEGRAPCEEKCKSCGRCYTFPTAEDILKSPELLLPSKPGFRYKYILDAADKVARGEVNLEKIKKAESYDYTISELMKIKGVGLKVAACTALFGFYNLEAFPIDVWMKRAIDEYFDGALDHTKIGKYAGVAQQYIFHYIRNLKDTQK